MIIPWSLSELKKAIINIRKFAESKQLFSYTHWNEPKIEYKFKRDFFTINLSDLMQKEINLEFMEKFFIMNNKLTVDLDKRKATAEDLKILEKYFQMGTNLAIDSVIFIVLTSVSGPLALIPISLVMIPKYSFIMLHYSLKKRSVNNYIDELMIKYLLEYKLERWARLYFSESKLKKIEKSSIKLKNSF